mmetsp:Transcript_45166/g.139344  ORF Transcript_45166/g.139344 Transcript_45166/m.139344 type:complete len:160 (-) Transcript_45166:300-779(-)
MHGSLGSCARGNSGVVFQRSLHHQPLVVAGMFRPRDILGWVPRVAGALALAAGRVEPVVPIVHHLVPAARAPRRARPAHLTEEPQATILGGDVLSKFLLVRGGNVVRRKRGELALLLAEGGSAAAGSRLPLAFADDAVRTMRSLSASLASSWAPPSSMV